MRNTFRGTGGYTLMEGVVVTAIGTLVFGLVLAAFIHTARSSEELMAGQQMRQEALLIGQGIEKVLRYRVDADQIALVPPAAREERGGAGASTPAAGGVTTSSAARTTVPRSLEGTLPTTATATPAPAPAARTPTAAELTSVPATIKPLLTTTGTAALERPVPGPGEHYRADELAVYSLSGGPRTEQLRTLIRNSRGLPGEARHAYLERTAPGDTGEGGEARIERLGGHPDRFQSSVSFRYATDFDGLNARWRKQSERVPRLVEYTVRVWPVGSGSDFDSARDAQGRPAGFQYTGAVRLP